MLSEIDVKFQPWGVLVAIAHFDNGGAVGEQVPNSVWMLLGHDADKCVETQHRVFNCGNALLALKFI